MACAGVATMGGPTRAARLNFQKKKHQRYAALLFFTLFLASGNDHSKIVCESRCKSNSFPPELMEYPKDTEMISKLNLF